MGNHSSRRSAPAPRRRLVSREELETKERQLREAQAVAHIGSWEWNVVTDTVTWSDELYRLFGLEPDSRPITFATYLGWIHPDDRTRVRRAVEQEIGRAHV